MMDKVSRSFFAFLCLCTIVGGSPAQDKEALREKMSELEAAAAASPMRVISFSEKRYFPFRKRPVELEGVLRIWQERGVSIVYPESGIGILADDDGVLLRRFSKNGTFRQKNAGMGESGTFDLLKAAFEFDVDSLEAAFAMEWHSQYGRWSIRLTPRSAEVEKVESLVLTGEALTILEIEMVFAGKRRIEIYPTEERVLEAFPAEEERLYFREWAGE